CRANRPCSLVPATVGSKRWPSRRTRRSPSRAAARRSPSRSSRPGKGRGGWRAGRRASARASREVPGSRRASTPPDGSVAGGGAVAECGDGVRDGHGGERCDRLEGGAGARALSATADLDLETGSPPSEFDRNASGRRIVRTRLEIGFTDGATIGDVNRVLDAADARIVMMLENVPILLIRIPDPGSVAALEELIARVVADPAVGFVDEAGGDEGDEVPENFSPAAASAPASSGPDFSKIDHHLAVRAAAAWNARAAMQPGAAPTILVADKFGDGPPDAAVSATFP